MGIVFHQDFFFLARALSTLCQVVCFTLCLMQRVPLNVFQERLLEIADHEDKMKAIPKVARANVAKVRRYFILINESQRYQTSTPVTSPEKSSTAAKPRQKWGKLNQAWKEPLDRTARGRLYLKISYGRQLHESDWLYPYFVVSRHVIIYLSHHINNQGIRLNTHVYNIRINVYIDTHANPRVNPFMSLVF